MLLSKEELKKKIDEVIEDEDVKISLLEDIEDSFVVSDDEKNIEKEAYESLKAEYEELKKKYKERFLSSDESKEEKEEPDESEEVEEIIDVKEI